MSAPRFVSNDGQTVVDVINLTCSTGRDGEWFRVKRLGFFAGEVRTVAELASLGVDVADLQEVPTAKQVLRIVKMTRPLVSR